MNKILGFVKAVLILLVVFLIGFLSFNLFMKIVVDHGQEEKTPDIVGMNFETARQVCRNNRLYLEEIQRINNDNFAKGQIISQEPHADIMTKRFRTVKVIVSDGPEMVAIPNMAGLSYAQAVAQLQNVKLLVGEKHFRYSDDIAKDNIISSVPMATESLPKGSSVDLIISLGKLEGNSSKYDKYKDILDDITPGAEE